MLCGGGHHRLLLCLLLSLLPFLCRRLECLPALFAELNPTFVDMPRPGAPAVSAAGARWLPRAAEGAYRGGRGGGRNDDACRACHCWRPAGSKLCLAVGVFPCPAQWLAALCGIAASRSMSGLTGRGGVFDGVSRICSPVLRHDACACVIPCCGRSMRAVVLLRQIHRRSRHARGQRHAIQLSEHFRRAHLRDLLSCAGTGIPAHVDKQLDQTRPFLGHGVATVARSDQSIA